MRNISIDILKVILAMFVVLLHLNIFSNQFPVLNFILVNGLFRIAVPLFLIISGYYFYSIQNFAALRKWMIRILGLYIIWMIIYLPSWLKKMEFNQIISTLIFGHAHLWYLAGTLFAGLILYRLRNLNSKILLTITLIFFSIGYLLQRKISSYDLLVNINFIQNKLYLYRNFLFFCLPFMTLGYIINKESIRKRIKPHILIILIAVLITILESYLVYKTHLYGYLEFLPSLLITSPLIFIYAININLPSNTKILADLSTAIYLVHIIIIGVFKRFGISQMNLIIECIGVITTTFIVSFILIIINKRLKYLL